MNRVRAAVLMIVAGAGLAACSAPAPAPAPAANQQPDGGVRLAAVELGSLGKVVTDKDGHTLYRYDKDTAKPSMSTCDGTCAGQWPPLLDDGAGTSVEGLDQRLVGTVTRTDGAKQITLNGWPLYRYAKDVAAGEANGQGVGKTWYAATPQGAKANGPVPPAKQEQPPADNGGYGY